MYLPEDEELVKTKFIKNETSVSNNVFERKLFFGFLNSTNCNNVRFVSAPSIGWYPKNCKKIKMKGFSKTNNYVAVEYLTTYFGSAISKEQAIFREIKNIIKKIELRKFKICLILNELHLPYLICAKRLKKMLGANNCVVVQLVPDLPEFNNRSKNIFYKTLKKINCRYVESIRKSNVDKYVLFSKSMINRLNLYDKKSFIVNEGITSTQNVCKTVENTDNKKHIVYIGKIDKRNGVELIANVAEMFSENDNIVFDLYGISASQGANIDYIANHKNIVMHGFTSPTNVPSILNKADILLSPRFSNDEYTKYSFPSKLFDYLAAFKPIITFRLECYPKEIDNFVIYPLDENKEALYESIKYALSGQYVVNKKGIINFLSSYSEISVANKIINLVEEKE